MKIFFIVLTCLLWLTVWDKLKYKKKSNIIDKSLKTIYITTHLQANFDQIEGDAISYIYETSCVLYVHVA